MHRIVLTFCSLAIFIALLIFGRMLGLMRPPPPDYRYIGTFLFGMGGTIEDLLNYFKKGK